MFFFPLFDDNPPGSKPIVTWMFILLCILVFLFQLSLNSFEYRNFINSYGLTPKLIAQFINVGNTTNNVNPLLTILTSAFIHGGWFHIGGNLIYLWIFGDNVEDSLGKIRFIFFYLLCAVFAGLCQFLVNPSSSIPMVGASGAIAGILASYLILHPRANIKVFVWFLIFIRIINIPAWIVLGFWIFSQFLSAPAAMFQDGGGIAYFAHIGGFVAGLILTPFFKRKEIKLFSPSISSSWEYNKLTKIEINKALNNSKKVSVPLSKKIHKTSVPKSYKRD